MPSQQKTTQKTTRPGRTLGLIAAGVGVVVAVLLAVFTSASGVGFVSHKITVYTYLTNAAGLKSGAEVDLDGVTIGTVKTVTLSAAPEHRKAPVQVTMRLNGKYRNQLHTDSIAQVVSSGALGDSGIDIATEKAVGPPLRDGGELPSRGMVDSLKAGQETMVRMSKTMGRLDQVVDGIESGKGTIGKIMSDPGLMNNVAATANGVHEVTAKLQSTNNSAGKLINDPSLGDKFASLSRDIQGVNASVARIAAGPLAANLKETQNRISVLKTDVDDGKGSVGMLIKDPNVRRRLTGSITQANQLMATANIRFGPKSDVRVNLDKLAGESNGLVAKIRSDPKKYLSFDVRLF